MLSINILCVGKIKEKFFREAITEYSKRLSKYCKLDIIELPDEKIPHNPSPKIIEEIKTKECNNLINHIKKDSYTICLDLNGKEINSENFSKKLDALSLCNSNVTFIIGGSLGLTQRILSLSKEKICFSQMTFPHQLIRIFLIEQIYRAFKISNGETYLK